MTAPAAANSSSGNRDPSPAPDCTRTVLPWCTSSATPSGCMETRFSLSLISLGTPMTKLAMTVLLAVRAVRAAGCGSLLVAAYLRGETESRKVWRNIQIEGNTFI